MNVTERVLNIDCVGQPMLGVLTTTSEVASVGVVVVVGGPQYRVGSHRQFVQLARRLAADGFPTLRFDRRGMGDSPGAAMSFEVIDDDLRSAIDALMDECVHLRGVVLWGLCDGASAALLYVGARVPDARVAGLCLVNPWVRSAATLARTQVRHYYLRRMRQHDFWRKLARGAVGAPALRDFVHSLALMLRPGRSDPLHSAEPEPEPERAAAFQVAMAAACERFHGPVQIVLSEHDYTAREFADSATADPAWRRALARPNVLREDISGADHTFSGQHARISLESICLRWLHRLAPRTEHVPA